VFGDVQPLSLLRARCEIIFTTGLSSSNRDAFISNVPIIEAKRAWIAVIYPREWRETVS